MKKRNKKATPAIDALKAFKAARRAEEIAEHGKPLKQASIMANKKKYSRKNKHKKKPRFRQLKAAYYLHHKNIKPIKPWIT